TSKNVTGARAVGMHAFRFTDAQQARRDLASLGMRF
ncbi:MAG TPA: HAD family phosphatase, partial [Bifidobacterium sp.]|nr:HAD family phosphatase [Bifidobacterium sp.]